MQQLVEVHSFPWLTAHEGGGPNRNQEAARGQGCGFLGRTVHYSLPLHTAHVQRNLCTTRGRWVVEGIEVYTPHLGNFH